MWLDLEADSAEIVARFCWTLPASAQWVRCHLRRGDELLSFNEYDLSVYDSGRPSKWQQLMSRLGDGLLDSTLQKLLERQRWLLEHQADRTQRQAG